MLRKPYMPYKFGRSTLREFGLMKVKQFADAEFEIVGFAERMHNANELESDELGLAKRSHKKAGMVPMGDLGALECSTHDAKSTFKVGSGFTEHDRKALWEIRETLIGQHVTVKYQDMTPKGVPRFPTYLRIRGDSA